MSTNIFNVDDNLEQAIDLASKIFYNGGIFIYPTDTIYGIGGNPFNEDVFKRIAKIKHSQKWKSFINLVDSLETLLKYVEIKNEYHYDFLYKIWPNPISVILKVNAQTEKIYNTKTMAFRIPNNIFCSRLLVKIKMPLISTSVNYSGKEALNDPEQIINEFSKDVDAVFYSNRKNYFVVSTLIDLSDDKLILVREGKIKLEEILKYFNSQNE